MMDQQLLSLNSVPTSDDESSKGTNPEVVVYDPDTFPPDVNIAIKHGQASRIGILEKQETNKSQTLAETCICCGNDTRVLPFTVTQDHKDFLYLGLGYPLFFSYLTWSILLMLMATLVFSLYAMYLNFSGTSCINTQTQAFQFLQVSCIDPSLDQSNMPCNDPSMQQDVLNICRYFTPNVQEVTDACCSRFCDYYSDTCLFTIFDQFYFPNQQFQIGGRLIQSILILVSVVLLIVLLQVMRLRLRLVVEDLDRDALTASDFTIIIRNLPAGLYNENDLRNGINNWWNSQTLMEGQCEITKINIAYDILQYSSLCVKKNQLTLKQRQMIQYQNKHNGQYPKDFDAENFQKLLNDIKDTQEKIDKIEKEAQSENSMKTSSIAFVSFRTQNQLRAIVEGTKTNTLQRWYYSIRECCGLSTRRIKFKGRNLDIERAPEPTDVLWENCGFTSKEKSLQRLKSGSITFLLMVVVFFMFLGLQFGQSKIFEQLDQTLKFNYYLMTGISLLLSFIVVAVNGGLTTLITYLTKMEHQSTLTHYNISMASKLIVTQFINTAVLTFFSGFIVTKLVEGNFDIRFQAAIQKKGSINIPINQGGVADDIFFIALSNSFSTPALLIIDPLYFYRVWKRKQILQNKDNTFMTQSEANYWFLNNFFNSLLRFQGKAINLYEKYCYTIRTIWVAALYAPLIPEIFIISILGFIITYWVEKVFYYSLAKKKYLFCKTYSRPPELNSSLNDVMVDFLEYLPFLLALGQLILNQLYKAEDELTILILDIVSVGISSIYFIVPGEELNRIIFNMKEDSAGEQTYDEALLLFTTDYDRTNPVTKDAALQQWMTQIKNQPEKSLVNNIVEGIGNIELSQLQVQDQTKQNLNTAVKSQRGYTIVQKPPLYFVPPTYQQQYQQPNNQYQQQVNNPGQQFSQPPQGNYYQQQQGNFYQPQQTGNNYPQQPQGALYQPQPNFNQPQAYYPNPNQQQPNYNQQPGFGQ